MDKDEPENPQCDDGELKEVDPRCIWPNEARDFTPWLAANIKHLTKHLPFDLESIEIETDIGGQYADITARVAGSDVSVIIENQLEESDDDHLVRIQSYAAKHDARIIIWVAKDFSDSHREIINWMNSNTRAGIAFYGFRVRAFKKGKSKPNPFFDLVIQPGKPVRTRNPNIAPEDERYRSFFQTIVGELSRRGIFKYETVRRKRSWFEFNTDLQGITYVAAFTTRYTARVEVHVRSWIGSNDQIYEFLVDRKQEIEDKLGEPLKWERRDRHYGHWHLIALYKPGSIDRPDEELTELNAWMIEKLVKLKQVFDPYLDDLGR